MGNSNTKLEVELGGREIGQVRNDTFYRAMKPSHFLKSPPAIAQDVAVLDKLEELGVERLEFRNSETGTKYRCSLEHFRQAGFLVDRGYGRQWALRLDGFSVEREGQQVEMPQKARQLAFRGW